MKDERLYLRPSSTALSKSAGSQHIWQTVVESLPPLHAAAESLLGEYGEGH